jgi:hypothetical protein
MVEAEPVAIRPYDGGIHPASPMELDSRAILPVVWGSMLCVVGGYAALLWGLLDGRVKDWALSIVLLHTFGVFALLVRYFGGTLHVSRDKAQMGS